MAKLTVSADFVVEYVADMNDRDEAYEGPVPHAIQRFERFELVEFDLSALADLGDYSFDPDLAAKYAAMSPETMPAIVVDGVDAVVIDGYHRANAVLSRGGKTILAYVGIDPAPGWEPYVDPDCFAP